MIESAAIATVAAVFFGAVVLPVFLRLALAAPRGNARPPMKKMGRITRRSAEAGAGIPARISRNIRFSSSTPSEIEAKVGSKRIRRMAMLIELYPERSLSVIRGWLHEYPE